MKLLVDVGNTLSVFGVWDGERVLRKWRLSTPTIGTEDQLWIFVEGFMKALGVRPPDIDRVTVSSVVPSMSHLLQNLCTRYLGLVPIFVFPSEEIGVTWGADHPREIGADRISNVLGYITYHASSGIVLDFGTAIKVEVITSKSFVGGIILPGPSLAMRALFSGTAKLPEVDLFFEDHVIGTNTGDNIRIGTVNATYYALMGLLKEIQEQTGPLPVLGTGGWLDLFEKCPGLMDRTDPDLTLKGIASFSDRLNR
ncbi:MAG TPA: type III pantothenate kinase [Thermotogota bacterium]|nr:type III pantothenate kinase [Thermotogota bacterium]HRW92269.1 type III pantothenate kinase [Thermotogota bacterium]